MNRMFPRVLFCLMALGGLLSSTTAFAQETSGGRPFIGVGFELDNIFSNALALATNADTVQIVYVPINLTPNLRIEPVFTFQSSSSTEFTEDKDNNFEQTEEESSSTLGLGVGAFYMWGLTDSIVAYGGGRLLFVRSSSSRREETNTPGNQNIMGISSSRNGFGIGGAIGTEWYFNKYMSLGGEAQLNFNYLGNPSTELEPNPGNDADGDSSTANSFAPNVELFFRFYFM